MIKVSEKAKNQVFSLIGTDGYPKDSFIRVGVKSGGC